MERDSCYLLSDDDNTNELLYVLQVHVCNVFGTRIFCLGATSSCFKR